jgi:hypothetical protein
MSTEDIAAAFAYSVRIIPGSNKEMLTQLRNELAKMSGTAEFKATVFEQLALQFTLNSKRSWQHQPRMVGADGTINSMGEGAAYAVTVSPEGRVFSG